MEAAAATANLATDLSRAPSFTVPRTPADRPLRIAMLAPPWISIPPAGYGGVESVVAALTESLVRRGHELTLFCAPGSRSSADVVELLALSHPDEIERSLYEADHVARAFEQIDAGPGGERFDLVHDHCGFTALAMADRLRTPMIHTLHGPFTSSTAAFYARHGHKATLVGISRAQIAAAPPGLGPIAMIPNPIAVDDWPLQEEKDDYLLWVGRMTPGKGPQRAIEAARLADRRLVMAGIVQPGEEDFFEREVAPLIDGDAVEFVGEVAGARKRSLFSRAQGLLMPIRWQEPFGMVMIEALACGTPVIAFAEGAAPELIVPGKTGFLVEDEAAMAAAIPRLAEIAPRDCRAWVLDHCDVDAVAASYERTFRTVARRPAIAAAVSLA